MKSPYFWFGGDYNPEQWNPDVWDDDIVRMNEAGVTTATLGVFAWAHLEPEPGSFDFDWFDDIVERLGAGGIKIVLATATASPPVWLGQLHPDTLPTDADGRLLRAGSRQQFSPSSATYRRYAARLARKLAERYGSHPSVIAWHVGNEYGCHVPRDFGAAGTTAFQHWLQNRYGDIDELNSAWGTAFWSQRYNAFHQILPPTQLPTFPNPAHALDWERFGSEELLACYRAEYDILRELTPDLPVTTNFMGFFQWADYWKWAPYVDFISDDHYPDPADPKSHQLAAMTRDLMRSLGNGMPWVLMEQSTSAVNWRSSNAPKAPGQNRALSYQSIARGADGILYFQWRQSRAGAEKFHSAMLPHTGPDSRIWREVVHLGNEIPVIADILGTTTRARVAIIFDWESRWSLEQFATPGDIDYLAQVQRWHADLVSLGVLTDFASKDADFTGYDLVIVPSLFCASEADLRGLTSAADEGTALVVTYQTGIVDQDAKLHTVGYLGPLAAALGVRVEEFAPLGATELEVSSAELDTFTATAWSEVTHLEGANAVATYASGWFAGHPAVARYRPSGGERWYIGTELPRPVRVGLLKRILRDRNIPAVDLPPNVELIDRGRYRFHLNHSTEPVELQVTGTTVIGDPPIDGLATLGPYGVLVTAGAASAMPGPSDGVEMANPH